MLGMEKKNSDKKFTIRAEKEQRERGETEREKERRVKEHTEQ